MYTFKKLDYNDIYSQYNRSQDKTKAIKTLAEEYVCPMDIIRAVTQYISKRGIPDGTMKISDDGKEVTIVRKGKRAGVVAKEIIDNKEDNANVKPEVSLVPKVEIKRGPGRPKGSSSKEEKPIVKENYTVRAGYRTSRSQAAKTALTMGLSERDLKLVIESLDVENDHIDTMIQQYTEKLERLKERKDAIVKIRSTLQESIS